MIIKKQNGFTLIELMVTIGIIAVLIAIILPSLNKAKARSRDAKRISDLAQIELALEHYYDRCGMYPPEPLSTSYRPLDATICPGVTFGTFLQTIPTPPLPTPYDGTGYRYVTNDTYSTFVLGAELELNNDVLIDDIDSGGDGEPLRYINQSGVETDYFGNFPGTSYTTMECDDSALNYCVGPN